MAEEKDYSTYAVKLDGDVKQELQGLLEGYKGETGATAGDFIKTLLEVYKTNKIVGKVSSTDADIRELNTLTNRIYGIYSNLLERNQNNNNSLQIEFADQLGLKETTINNLRGKIDGIVQEQELLTEAYNSICEDKKELVNNNIQLQKLNDSLEFNNSKLIEDTKGLLLLKDVNIKLSNEIETVKGLLADSQSKSIELRDSVKDKDFTINNLNKDIDKAKSEYDKFISELNSKHDAELKQLEEKTLFRIEKKELEVQKVQQDHLSQEQEKHNATIEAYQIKYKALLEELEKERSIPKVKTSVIKKDTEISEKNKK